MLKQIFSAVPDGRVPYHDLLPLGAGGLPVCATQARIATHAHAMPPATQPAVTQASPILFGCRVLDGQVVCDEDPRDVGLRAEQVACERPESLSFSEDALHNPVMPANTADYIMTALINSLTWAGR